MKPFEEGKLIGEVLVKLREERGDTLTEEELCVTADLLARYLADSDDEKRQRTLSAGIIWGATQE